MHLLTVAEPCRQLADLAISCYLLQNNQSIFDSATARGGVAHPHPSKFASAYEFFMQASPSSGARRFLYTNISQGGVATYLTMDGVFNYYFVTHSLLSMLMTEFRKSVSIWQSYVQKYIGTFSVHGVGYRIISETWAYWTDLSEIRLVNRHHKYDHE